MKEPGMILVTEESRTFGPPESVTQRARIKSMEEYQKMYRASLDDPQGFWGACAGELVWTRPWDRVLEDDFRNGKVKWFVGGKLNAATNCLDRHLHTPRKDKVAILWEGESGETKAYTYQQLHAEVCRFANAL